MAEEPAGSSLSDLCVLQEVSQGLVLPWVLGERTMRPGR